MWLELVVDPGAVVLEVELVLLELVEDDDELLDELDVLLLVEDFDEVLVELVVEWVVELVLDVVEVVVPGHS